MPDTNIADMTQFGRYVIDIDDTKKADMTNQKWLINV